MDKEILNYLDKVGQYLQGAGEKGFETYVHGVFVNSLIGTIFGIILIVASIFLTKIAIKHWSFLVYKDMEVFAFSIPVLFIIGVVMLATSVVGVFAPDYVAIKEIAENIGGK